MRRNSFTLAVASVLCPIALWGQASLSGSSAPDPREIAVPEIETTVPKMPGPEKLPSRPGLPDVLTMDDGTKVTSIAEWPRRRAEMLAILEYVARRFDQFPPPVAEP